MEEIELLVDLHKNNERQGPGSHEMTTKALEFIDIPGEIELNLLDIGCGTGAQTFTLAEHLNATITAVDFSSEFLKQLEVKSNNKGMADRITALNCSMDNLPFQKAEFDIIWSEGAIYNIGFEKGLHYWKNFVKPEGYIAVTELSWFTEKRPTELEDYWKNQYPGIDTISGNVKSIENIGLQPVANFILPNECWTDNYYNPLQKKFPEFLVKHGSNPNALKLVENEMKEIDVFNKYNQYFGYAFYIARLTKEM